MKERDVVVVGGGIAGGALALVLASEGVSVLVLERQLEHRDRVRGEILWPWGVRVARTLGVEQVLLGAGAQIVSSFDFYDETLEGPVAVDVAGAVTGIGGSLNITHPRACTAMIEAARLAEADVRPSVHRRVSHSRSILPRTSSLECSSRGCRDWTSA